MTRCVMAGALWLVLTGCAGRASSPPSVAESAPALVEAASTEEAPDDHSLTWPVYRAAGVPEIDHAWSVDDYERALRVFGKMLASTRADLPRHGSKRSGNVFARLVTPDNFASVEAPSTALAQARLGERYLGVFPALLQLYSPASDGLDFATEQGELIIALLELLKSVLEASRLHAADDVGWSEQYEHQKSVTVGVLRGVNAMLLEHERYSPPLRQRLKREAVRLGPQLARHLEDEHRRLVVEVITP